MTVLELRFPAGRYHATPWGRHVNEGAVEWPPSPWRILRALIATWYWKAQKNDEISEEIIRSLIHALSEPPVFCLPRATTAHTRHYMPLYNAQKTTKIFDTFIQLAENESLLVAWNSDLSPELLTALKMLAARLGYFGRAESLVEARVLEGITAIKPNAQPIAGGANLPDKYELVRLLAPAKPVDYENWRTSFLSARQQAGEKKRPGKKSKKVETPQVPEDLFAALHAETGELHDAGWNLPPGAEYINYIRPENAFAPAIKPRLRQSKKLPTVARYAVVSVVSPSITQAISVADRVHKTLCSYSDRSGAPGFVFTGLDEQGKPRSDHAHAHIFCEANGPRDAITHIVVTAEMGFDEAACLALRKLNHVWGHGGHDIRLVLHGIGQPMDFEECPLFGRSKKWVSFTPFVSTRHAKAYRDGRPKIAANGWQEGSAPHDLLRLLAQNPNWQEARIVRQLNERDRPFCFGEKSAERRFCSLQFQTIRHNGNGKRGNGSGGGFIIEFPEPVRGPIAVGYGAHFGLGLFMPMLE
jgi:CRISPR-associated protein Csb2